MAITKPIKYKGFDTNAYYKITSAYWNEKGVDEEGNKTYNFNCVVNSFTNDTKEFEIDQKDYIFETNITGLTIDNGYNELKKLEEFSEVTDC